MEEEEQREGGREGEHMQQYAHSGMHMHVQCNHMYYTFITIPMIVYNIHAHTSYSILTYGDSLLHGGHSPTAGWVSGKHSEGVLLTSLVLCIRERVRGVSYGVIYVHPGAGYGDGVINSDILKGTIGLVPGENESGELLGVRVQAEVGGRLGSI